MAPDAEKTLSESLDQEAEFSANDAEAHQTAEALVATHIGQDNRVEDLAKFVEDLAAALIAARTAGRENRL